MRSGKRKSSGHEKGSEQEGHGNEKRSPKVKSCEQAAGNQRTYDSSRRDGAAHGGEGKQRQQGGQRNQQQEIAGQGGEWRVDGAVAAPTPAEYRNRHGEQKRSKAKYLEQQVRGIRANRPHPVVGHTAIGRLSADVEGSVARGVRNQGQCEQDRQRNAQKAY